MNQALHDDLQALAVSDEGLLSDTLLRGRNGDIHAHLALLEVRCPQLAEKAVREPGRSPWTISLPEASVEALRHLLLYLYTDGLPSSFDENPAPVLDLLAVAGSLVSRDPPCAFSGEGRIKKSRLEKSPCEMRRLCALCEHHLCASLTQDTVVDVLQTAMKIGSKKLENGIYQFLGKAGNELIKSVSFNQSLFAALGSEHPEAVARAVSAAAGSTQVLPSESESDASQSIVVSPSKFLQHLTTLFESSREADGTPLDLDSRIDCWVCWGVPETSQLAVHRCILAARSAYFARMLSAPMRESSSGHIPITLPVDPSSAAVNALLRYLYTGTFVEVDGQHLTACDLVDVLSIVDGPGGRNFLQLSQKAYSRVRELVVAILDLKMHGNHSMMFLHRSIAQQSTTLQSLGFEAALQACKAECRNLDSFKTCIDRAEEEWWTPAMVHKLLVELLWRRCAMPTGYEPQPQARMAARRKEEYEFVKLHDTKTSEVWYVTCAHWLDTWKDFVRGLRGPPDRITNHHLMDASGSPLPDKEPFKDFRGINFVVWRYLHARYGGGPEIKRPAGDGYKVQLYA
ncbi:USP20 [Symbiodinium necroappetens]|uniref:USP20 protein n=1 Tax=Symbiodinium necroappetens TaxID=1628268 RepID=A0A812U6F5_9DINO|nr:USP20 [Symbiodinium necroappetens]